MSSSTAELVAEPVAVAPEVARAPRWPAYIALFVITLMSACTTTLAMRRTSTTFDEIVMIAGGARGFETGRFDIAPEHPPLTQYLYGLPVYLDGVKYPVEVNPPKDMGYRYRYAREFFWRVGNDPERVAFLGRLGAVACAAGLIVAVFFFALRWGAGPARWLWAATVVKGTADNAARMNRRMSFRGEGSEKVRPRRGDRTAKHGAVITARHGIVTTLCQRSTSIGAPIVRRSGAPAGTQLS